MLLHLRPPVGHWARVAWRGAVILWRAIVHFVDDDGLMLAGAIAFSTLFALFPFLIFLTTLAGEIGQDAAVREFVEQSLRQLPPEVSAVIQVPIEEVIRSRRTGLMTISIVTALWVASSGLEALRTALNLAYGIEEPRAIWWRRLQSMALTMIFSISIILVMIVEIAGPFLWSYVERLADLPRFWQWLYDGLGHATTILLFYLVIVLLYRVLPNRRLGWLEILPGAMVTVVLWLGLARLFSFYLQNLGRFTWTYGSLGGIVITLMFFYISAAIFIFGAEINGARRRILAEQLRAERRQVKSG